MSKTALVLDNTSPDKISTVVEKELTIDPLCLDTLKDFTYGVLISNKAPPPSITIVALISSWIICAIISTPPVHY